MKRICLLLGALIGLGVSSPAAAVSSAELYTNQSYQYGRFAARIQFAPGSGVVSSFFLWKDGSEIDGTFWNELDFEKLEEECRVETNAIFGDPEEITPERVEMEGDLCGESHTYVYEWTPDYIAWFIDGREVRRETGEVADAFREHATEGMQLRFNVWPGDATFGGEFDPSILPVYQYIDWVEYSSYADGAFELQWREEFDGGAVPSGWSLGSWESPKGLSTHATANFGARDGIAVLALTADDARGTDGATPPAPEVPPAPAMPPGTGDTPPAPTTSVPGEPPAPPGAPPVTPDMGGTTTPPSTPGEPPSTPAPTTPGGAAPPTAPPVPGEQPAPGSAPAASGDPATPGGAAGVPDAPAASPQLGDPADPNDADGCGCRVVGSVPASSPPLGLAMLVGVALWRRGRTRKRA